MFQIDLLCLSYLSSIVQRFVNIVFNCHGNKSCTPDYQFIFMPMQYITPPIYKYIFYKLKANFLCQCFISRSTYHTPTWTDGQADSFIPPNCVLEKVDKVSILKMVWKRTSSKLFNMLNYCLWSSNGPMSLIITRNVGPIRLGHTTTIYWMVP